MNDCCTGCNHRGAYNCGDLCARKFMDKYNGQHDIGNCVGCEHEGTTHGSCKRCLRHYKDYFECSKPVSSADMKNAMLAFTAASTIIAMNPAKRTMIL